MVYLTPDQVLFIHCRLIEETGGSHGIRDIGLFESAIARPMASFDDVDLYPDIFSKAASLMHSLIKNHPFVDGNKRATITASSLFPARNGQQMDASNQELERFTLKAASTNVEVEEIVEWLKKYTTPPG